MSVWRRLWLGLKGWFERKNAGEKLSSCVVMWLVWAGRRGAAGERRDPWCLAGESLSV